MPSDPGDPLLNTWILWWNAHHIPLTHAWWNAPNFFPATDALAFSEHLVGLTPISSPIIWLTGNPQLAYNLTLLLTFPLSVTAAYVLGTELTGRRDAGLIAGFAFGFAPYRIAQLPHLQVLASFWMPVALFTLHRALSGGGLRWFVLFGTAFLMQALSNGYYLPYLSTLVGLWMLWFIRPRMWRTAAAIGAAWLGAVACVVPILLKYRAVHALHGLSRQPGEVLGYSADVASILDASPRLLLWGWLHVFHRPEGELFPGLTVPVLAIAGGAFFARQRDTLSADAATRLRLTWLFYAVAAIAMFALAMGPAPTLVGEPFLSRGPYAWLMRFPGMPSLRVPARFSMLMLLCLAMAASLAFGHLTRAWPNRRRWISSALLSAAIACEGWMSAMPLLDQPRAWVIQSSEISGALLVLPILNDMNEAANMYRAMAHGRPIVNGYSGYRPAWYRALEQGLNDRDPGVLDAASRAGVTQIAVSLRNDRGGLWRTFVETRATRVRVSPDDTFALYDLPPRPADPAPARTIPIRSIDVSSNPEAASAMLDGRTITRWFTSDPQRGGETVVADLGSMQPVSGVELQLGLFGLGYPRLLVVELSPDRVTWSEVWHGQGAGPAVDAGFRSPATTPMTVAFGEKPAKYVRLRQTGHDDTATWSIAELRVLAK